MPTPTLKMLSIKTDVQLNLGTREGRLDHYSSFIFKVEGNKNDITLIANIDSECLYVYIADSYTITNTQNTLIYENHGEFKDYFKIYNHTQNAIEINFYAIVNGEKKIIADSKIMKPKKSDYQIGTNVKNKTISQFFFEITQGTFNNVYFNVKDDDLYIKFE